jgi:hypothetical protein
MTTFAPVRLALVAAAIGIVWGLALPAVQRIAVIQRHVAAMEDREVNPAAMVYTELDRLPIRPKWVEDRVILWPYFWP